MFIRIENTKGNTIMEFHILSDDVNIDDILCTYNCDIADVLEDDTVRIQEIELLAE